MKHRTLTLQELSEVRTCASIIGLAVSRLVKKHLPEIKKNEELYQYVRTLDTTLTRLDEHIKKLEALSCGLEYTDETDRKV